MTKKRKILLVHLPQWCIDQPPLGISYLTGYLAPKGYEVQQRDLGIEFYHDLPAEKKHVCDSLYHELWLHEESYRRDIQPLISPYLERWARELASSDAPFIGFTTLSTNQIPTLIIAKMIKDLAPEKTILIGGPYVTRYEGGFRVAENPSVDYVVPDEGEEATHELLERLVNGEDVSTVVGLIYRDDGKIKDTGQRKLIAHIGDLPYPRYDQFPLKNYRRVAIPILGSRGCIYSCSFCSETVFWRRYRFRSGENLFGEFKYQSENLGIKSFYIVDSLINGNIRELEKMCDLLIESGVEAYWGGKASIRMQMTSELLKKMYKAGCRSLDYGIESGSPKVLKDMKKQFDLPLATRVLRDSHEAGISVGVFMLVGFPTETEQCFELSKQFLKEHQGYLNRVTPGYGCGIQPGSDLYVNKEKYGIYFKEDGWYSEHVSPPILRKRVKEFREFCGTLDIMVT